MKTLFLCEIAMKLNCVRDERLFPGPMRDPDKDCRDTPFTRRRIEKSIGPGCFPEDLGPPSGQRLWSAA